MLVLLLACSGLLLAQAPASGESPSLEETYAPWKERVRIARAELDKYKAEREKILKGYDAAIGGFYTRLFRGGEEDAKQKARIAELDDLIAQKEYELNTTIPDEARRAGVPAGVLTQ
jgi:hypothetical protein